PSDAPICEATRTEAELPGLATSSTCTWSFARAAKLRSYSATLARRSAWRPIGTAMSSAPLHRTTASERTTSPKANHLALEAAPFDLPKDEPGPESILSWKFGRQQPQAARRALRRRRHEVAPL